MILCTKILFSIKSKCLGINNFAIEVFQVHVYFEPAAREVSERGHGGRLVHGYSGGDKRHDTGRPQYHRGPPFHRHRRSSESDGARGVTPPPAFV